MRGDQTSRQWQLIRLISGQRGRTLAQLKAELGVSKRTIQRDMDALERGGFPITSEERNGTVFWRFMEGFRVETPLSLELTVTTFSARSTRASPSRTSAGKTTADPAM